MSSFDPGRPADRAAIAAVLLAVRTAERRQVRAAFDGFHDQCFLLNTIAVPTTRRPPVPPTSGDDANKDLGDRGRSGKRGWDNGCQAKYAARTRTDNTAKPWRALSPLGGLFFWFHGLSAKAIKHENRFVFRGTQKRTPSA